ncbi:MAG TPA: prepilin-type N-terminal cleavage/methylation domain-containing protein [Actinomycetota bacterium]|nr:prepilin-type N-terminal cleavage/methylation domain-containing protein [Actinomycetota bacterium]
MRRTSPSFARASLSDERGITLVEVMIATAILGIVMLVFTTTLASIQQAVVAEDVRNRLNDQARLALADLDRQVRSGNLLYDPASETEVVEPFGVDAESFMFRVYTQTKYQETDEPRCALWLIDDERRLLYRHWPVQEPNEATDWRVVAEGVVNRETDTPAFALDPAGRTVTVTIEANADLDHDPTATQSFSASLTGRNTSFGYPSNVCQDLPSDMTA